MVNIAAKGVARNLRTHRYEKVITGREYERRAREKFKEIMPTVAWKESGELLKQTEISPGDRGASSLGISPVRDFNMGKWHKSAVTSVDFHPHDNLLLTAGLDKNLKLFQFDGKTTSLLESIFLPDMPIYCARFTADGKEIIISGRRGFFYTFDLSTSKVTKEIIMGNREKSREVFWITPDNKFIVFRGSQGTIVIVDRSSHRLVKVLKISGDVRTICFSKDGSILYAAGSDSEIYEFSLKTFRCVSKRITQCMKILSLNHTEKSTATGSATNPQPKDGVFIVGDESGLVTLYPKKLEEGKTIHTMKSLKVYEHLTTPITTLAINPNGTMMLVASKYKRDALRMVNLKANIVYENWPRNFSYRFIQSAAFSPNNKFLALGIDTGRVRMFQFK